MGAHADGRRPTPTAYARLRTRRVVARRRRGRHAARAPRRAGGRRLARAPPHRGHADAPGRASGPRSTRRVLRLAAGGFRDMTRIAAGHPGIWPDICAENRDAIVDVLDDAARRARRACATVVADGDRDGLLRTLGAGPRRPGSTCRPRAAPAEELVEVRVPVPDRPGVLAEVTTLAGELGVNIYDLEIAHSAEGDRGVLLARRSTRRAVRPAPGRAARPRATGSSVQPLAHEHPARRAAGGASGRGCGCRGRRASPTGPWCARRWPTASRSIAGAARCRRHSGA